jgi:hypothetical protein
MSNKHNWGTASKEIFIPKVGEKKREESKVETHILVIDKPALSIVIDNAFTYIEQTEKVLKAYISRGKGDEKALRKKKLGRLNKKVIASPDGEFYVSRAQHSSKAEELIYKTLHAWFDARIKRKYTSGAKWSWWLGQPDHVMVAGGKTDNYDPIKKSVGALRKQLWASAKGLHKKASLTEAEKLQALLVLAVTGVDPIATSTDSGNMKKLQAIAKNTQSYLGVQIGHAEGGAVQVSNVTAEHMIKWGTSNPNLDTNGAVLEQGRALKIAADNDTKLDIVNRVHAIAKHHGIKTNFHITLIEDGKGNKSGGTELGNVMDDARGRIKATPALLLEMEGSPTSMDLRAQLIIDNFLQVRTKVKSGKATHRARVKIPSTAKLVHLAAGRVEPKPHVVVEGSESDSLNIPNMLVVINKELHNAVRGNMGKGNAQKNLNYRTGRFAASTELLALTSSATGKSLFADVTYMKRPYDTFAPGGRLYNELRDPKRIIGMSVRQIMAKQFALTLPTRMRVV